MSCTKHILPRRDKISTWGYRWTFQTLLHTLHVSFTSQGEMFNKNVMCMNLKDLKFVFAKPEGMFFLSINLQYFTFCWGQELTVGQETQQTSRLCKLTSYPCLIGLLYISVCDVWGHESLLMLHCASTDEILDA